MPPEIRKVKVAIHRAGAGTALYDADLIYIDTVPHVVIEWVKFGEQEHPLVIVPLNPAHLHEFRMGAADLMYEMTIEDPRRLS